MGNWDSTMSDSTMKNMLDLKNGGFNYDNTIELCKKCDLTQLWNVQWIGFKGVLVISMMFCGFCGIFDGSASRKGERGCELPPFPLAKLRGQHLAIESAGTTSETKGI